MSEERRYSEPIPGHPTESFEARIEHWMGDLTEFQSKLGMHDPGNGIDPYFPKLSGVMTSNSRFDAMVAFDMKRYPEKWAEPTIVLPPNSRREDVFGAVIRFWFKAKRVWAIGTDRESVKKIARIRVAKTWNAVERWINDVLMVKLGAPKPKKEVVPLQGIKSNILTADFYNQLVVDPDMEKRLYELIRVRRAERDRARRNPDDPGNDGLIFDS